MADRIARIIIQEMLRYANDGNSEMVTAINDLYEDYTHKVYKEPSKELDSEYDRCRTSCFMSVHEGYADLRTKYMTDAKQRMQNLLKLEK